jgi:hypothetical protein
MSPEILPKSDRHSSGDRIFYSLVPIPFFPRACLLLFFAFSRLAYVKRLRRTENVRRTFEGVSAPREFAEQT